MARSITTHAQLHFAKVRDRRTNSGSGTTAARSTPKEAGHDRRGRHNQARSAALGDHRPGFRAARLADVLQGDPDESPDHVSRADVARMKRALDAVLAAPAAAAFVACVELLLMRSRRGRSRIEKIPVPAPARLRVRRGTDGARAPFAIAGRLDEFSARLRACAVAQTPAGATVLFELHPARPSRATPVGVGASACS